MRLTELSATFLRSSDSLLSAALSKYREEAVEIVHEAARMMQGLNLAERMSEVYRLQTVASEEKTGNGSYEEYIQNNKSLSLYRSSRNIFYPF